jgi:ankyrin repeat protein
VQTPARTPGCSTLVQLRLVAGGSPSAAQCLLDAGAYTGKLDRNGCAPLHYAAGEGYTKVVSSLIEAGANIDSQARESQVDLAGLLGG